jgi:hypothetical protein
MYIHTTMLCTFVVYLLLLKGGYPLLTKNVQFPTFTVQFPLWPDGGPYELRLEA